MYASGTRAPPHPQPKFFHDSSKSRVEVGRIAGSAVESYLSEIHRSYERIDDCVRRRLRAPVAQRASTCARRIIRGPF